jgi:GNAT superfamily N-acetyltransferase
VLLSPSAAVRVERVEVDYLRVRVGALAAAAGNPYGAAVRPVGDGWAFLVEAVPNPLFNHVMGLTAGAVAGLSDLADWYARHGRPLRVDVTPEQADRALLTALTGHGLSQTGFYAGLYAELAPADRADPGDGASGADRGAAGQIDVSPADPQEFSEVYVAGFGFPDRHRAAMAESVRVLAGCPDAHFYRARLGPVTAGVGLLFRSGGVGYLATAATLPEHRGRGVQGALVRHRIAVARGAGCDLVVGHTAVGSASQRTMERNGLRLAFTKALWSTPG